MPIEGPSVAAPVCRCRACLLAGRRWLVRPVGRFVDRTLSRLGWAAVDHCQAAAELAVDEALHQLGWKPRGS